MTQSRVIDSPAVVHPRAFQMIVIAKALEIWANHGIKVNRAYSPKAMMSKARELTGEEFGARDYVKAAKALRAAANKE